MIRKILNKKSGFTLVEVLIAMAIFMMFSGILINSYGSIVKSQREANDYRILYSEGGKVFEVMVRELREGMVDYEHYQGSLNGVMNEIYLVRKDGMAKTHIVFDLDTESLKVGRGELDTGLNPGQDPVGLDVLTAINSENVKVKNVSFLISPMIDPYDIKYVNYDLNQFHPKVTIFAEFSKMIGGKEVVLPLQTTISSRIYNKVY